jgi:FixJ family two-component response regulator
MRDVPALIAIIDDDASVCRALQRLIRSFGMRTSIFASGELFLLDLTSAERPDCVLLDVQMPGMNGFEVREQLARDRLDLPLIFITAHNGEGIEGRASDARAVGLLHKPFTDHALMELLKVALHPLTGNDSGVPGEVR